MVDINFLNLFICIFLKNGVKSPGDMAFIKSFIAWLFVRRRFICFLLDKFLISRILILQENGNHPLDY